MSDVKTLGALPIGARIGWGPIPETIAEAEVAALVEGGYHLRMEDGLRFLLNRRHLEDLHALELGRIRVDRQASPLPRTPPPDPGSYEVRPCGTFIALRTHNTAQRCYEYTVWEPATATSHAVYTHWKRYYGLLGSRIQRQKRSRKHRCEFDPQCCSIRAYTILFRTFPETFFGAPDQGTICLMEAHE